MGSPDLQESAAGHMQNLYARCSTGSALCSLSVVLMYAQCVFV
jgi:hypothetical protein